MALPLANSLLLLLLFSFFSLFFIFHAKIDIHPSDLKAFLIFHKDLGFNHGQRQPFTTHPCDTDGVFCERRLSSNESYVIRITRIIFKSKKLNGVLSPAIGRLSELKELSLSDNQLASQIPTQIVDCRKLEILDVGNNRFSGEVPSELSSLIRLRVLDISSNKFSGNLNFLTYFPNLEILSVADNLFTGRVPASVRSFRNLQRFNFSGNYFLEIPPSLWKKFGPSASDIPKRYILTENSAPTTTSQGASAPAPKSRKHGYDNSSFQAGPAQAPTAQHHEHKSRKRKLAGWIFGFLAGAFAGSISGFIFSLLFKLAVAVIKGGGKSSGTAIYSPLIKKAEDLAFLEKEDGLSSLEIIGKGGCGEVYKAGLPGSNKIIAIKKVVQPSKDAAELSEEDSKLLNKKMRQIRSEINTVGQIRHRNLLPLLAHLSRPDCHYLVYEYMKNGSLQDVLNQVQAGVRELDWLARHKIAVGVASGLEYLHTHHTPRIIHRDLKPGNILLDDDMEARIADFGLAKAMPEAYTHVSTSNVAGTVGYIAPEYHQTVKFTDKCDIYSFGVVLGSLVMGKIPSDAFFQETEELSLVKWMRNVMTSDNPTRAIDEKLRGNGYEEQMLLVLKIACFCTLDDPKERPNSKDIRCMLSQIKH